MTLVEALERLEDAETVIRNLKLDKKELETHVEQLQEDLLTITGGF
jgi:hypothetical protein